MKKLMIASALAAFCGAVVLADGEISSENVVGYNTMSSGLYPAKTGGMCFVTSGDTDGTFRLGDLKMTGSTWGSDWLGFVDPVTSIIDISKDVTYYSEAEAIADGGTADDAEWENIAEECKDNVTYPIGTAFLCNFVNTGITITFAGQVYTASSTINCAGKPAAFVANIYPGDLTAGDLKMVNSTWGSDWVQFIDPATSAVDPTKDITYYSEAEAIADGGTADDAEWENISEECKDDVQIPIGSGFLCNFVSPNVQIIFPAISL